jgi:hypothetical protein
MAFSLQDIIDCSTISLRKKIRRLPIEAKEQLVAVINRDLRYFPIGIEHRRSIKFRKDFFWIYIHTTIWVILTGPLPIRSRRWEVCLYDSEGKEC